MKDAFRDVQRRDAPDPDEVDGLAPPPRWHMSCPGGSIVVRTRDAVDEFGGLLAVASFLRQAGKDNDLRDSCVHVRTELPGERALPLRSRLMKLSAKRQDSAIGERTVTVYVVNLETGARDVQDPALSFLFTVVRQAVAENPKQAATHGVSVVLR